MASKIALKGHIKNFNDVKNFLFGGKAIFTLKSTVSDKHFTFEVKSAGEDKPDLFYVSLLNGSDNYSNYTYFGYIAKGKYGYSSKSKLNKSAPGILGFEWFYNNFVKGGISEKVEFWSEGICSCCGKKLTVPSSLNVGLGDICRQKFEATAV